MKRRSDPLRVYRALYRAFGPQGWWPFTRDRRRGPEYRPSNFRPPSEAARWEICIGAILTQNTAWTNVDRAIRNLLAADALSPRKILAAPFSRLCRWIRPSGYFRQKARRLKDFLRTIRANGGADLKRFFRRPLAEAREVLLSVSGIGPETADSMLLYAGGRPVFVVDAYTRRIGRRIGWFRTEDYEAIRSFFESRLPASVRLFNEFHALLVRLGKEFCKKEPDCPPCPIRRMCRYGLSHA